MTCDRVWRARAHGAVLAAGIGLTALLAQGQSLSDNPAGGPPTLAKAITMSVPGPGLNDMLQATPLPATSASHWTLDDCESAVDFPPPPIALADRLRMWDSSTRRNTLLQVELPASSSAPAIAAAGDVEALWNAGQYERAIVRLHELETGGTPVALGVSCRAPQPAGTLRFFDDVRIGTRTGGVSTELDYDAVSGALFAVVRWDTDDGWALYRSDTDGGSWTELYFWYAGAGENAVDVDMAVVGNYVYVGYVASNVAVEARLRRIIVSTGQVDAVYGYKVALPSEGSAITDVAVESNIDSSNNRIYYALRQSNNAVRFAWDESTDGSTFTEISPAGTAALGGLDLCWNPGFASYYVFLSYVGTDSRVHVLRRTSAAWDAATSAPFDGTHVRSAISAWDDHVICAHELQMPNGQGIRYFITHDGGETWDFYNYIAEPDSGEGPYQMADVTARGGAGTAIVFTHEVGEPDDVLIRYRRNYAPGLWHDAIRVNSRDVATGSWTALSWTPRDTASSAELSYGTVYFSGSTPYFNRLQRRPGDTNCDGEITFMDIDPLVAALSGQAVYEAVFPDCDWYNADCDQDGDVDFFDIDPFVALLGT